MFVLNFDDDEVSYVQEPDVDFEEEPTKEWAPWDAPTQPEATPSFMQGFDDDYVLDPELGGEGESG